MYAYCYIYYYHSPPVIVWRWLVGWSLTSLLSTKYGDGVGNIVENSKRLLLNSNAPDAGSSIGGTAGVRAF